jgi:alcohol dehydrogenase class IV
MGATAFQKGLGGMHALAHPLGGLYNAHHGMLNAILMPYVLKANRYAIEERIKRLTRYMNLNASGFDGFLDWVLQLRKELKIPHTLAGLEINASRADIVAQMATEDPSAGGNPINFSKEEYKQIFLNAVEGNL